MKKCELHTKFDTYLNLHYQSKRTLQSYTNCFWKFVNTNTNIDRLTSQQIKDYLIEFKRTYSVSYYNQMVSMLYILYRKVLNQPRKLKGVSLLKQPDTLHTVMSIEDIREAIGRLSNLKHKAIISTLYLTGMRVSELISLRISDVNSTSIHVRSGKGRKDRYIPVNDNLITLLREYWKEFKPTTYLFESYLPGRPYSSSSVRAVCTSAGIPNPHLLRHSIITHLVDSGDQQLKIQLFAGHASAKSTLKYYHMAPNSINQLTIPAI